MVPMISRMLALHRRDAMALIREAGLPDDALHRDVIAPLSRVQKFVDLTAVELDAPQFGLDLAAHVPAGAFGLIEFLIRSAQTLDHAFRVLCEFWPVINPGLAFHYVIRNGQGRIHLVVASQREALGCHLNEYTMNIVVRQFSAALDAPLPVEQIWFAHTRAVGADDVAARFGCAVKFGAPDCGLAVSGDWLERKMSTANAPLFEFLQAQARAQLANVESDDVVSHLARILEARLQSGRVAAPDVAQALATTQRSLQRRLAEAGTSYREVLHHVRLRRRAELERAGLETTQVARRLGFSSVAVMRRSLESET